MQLYEINSELQEIVSEMEAIALSDEYADEEKERQLSILMLKYNSLDGVKEEKALELVRAFKNAQSAEIAIKTEIESLTVRMKSHKTKAESIKRFLSSIITPGDKLEDGSAKISWRKSEQVWYDEMNIGKLPMSAIKTVQTISKTELKNWIKEYGDTAYCRLETNMNIQLK